MDQAYATAVVLLVLVIGINWLSGFISEKDNERKRKWRKLVSKIWIFITVILKH